MISVFYKDGNKLLKQTDIVLYSQLKQENLVWVDLVAPTIDEKVMVENFMEINLLSRQQTEEIESSSRYFETDELIIANSNFLVQQNGSFSEEPVSLLLKDYVLISLRNTELKSFTDTIKKFENNIKPQTTGFHILVTLFEVRIDLDADFVENIAREITVLSKSLTIRKSLDEEIILNITKYQENTMLIRENIIDKQRVISGILKSENFPHDTAPKLRIIIKDISSLLDHTAFSFERLEYLQNTFLGLINIEQNSIIKIFTVASVVFMPPTLIASIYGMNFKVFPEVSWTWGYPFAILLMIFSSAITLFIFKRKNWL
jgi:magnesium transporter